MSKYAPWLLLPLAVALGCVTTQPTKQGMPPPTWSLASKQAAPAKVEQTVAEKPPQPARPLTADQVTNGNAHKVVDSLKQELDQDDADIR